MRKSSICITAAAVLIFTAGANGQVSVTNLQVGMLNPKAVDSGLLLKAGLGKEFDEMVELGISLDFYIKSKTDKEYIGGGEGTSGAQIDTVVENFKTSSYMFPVTANITIKVPVEFPVFPYVDAGLGYVLLWNSYDNYFTGEGDTKFYGGMCWRIAAGGFYPLGSKSALTAELFYFGGKPSHSEGESERGLPTRTEVNMSGLGFRLGIKLFGNLY